MPHLLKYEDKNSMKNSIETRLPFIDYEVLETSLSLSNTLKIKDGWTKYILRKTANELLPKNIVWRKNKLGFEAPTKSWLSHIEKEMKTSINTSKIIQQISNTIDFDTLNEKQKWKLFNIAKWEHIYNVSIK
jgi:asparagine synthase (glutamine-hydrolysing)